MYRSILVRGVEVIYAFEEAIRILETLGNAVSIREENTQSKTHPSSVSIGMAATEAPRGLLFHRYLLDEHETIVSANIISPTSQNQGAIEEHLLAHAQELSHTELGARASDFERIVRSYDPCISCATHFLTVRTQS